MKKSSLLIRAAAIAMAFPMSAHAFPEDGRVITMIVPSSAGGGTDTVARLIGPLMQEDLGIPVEIENRPGASMQIGLTYAANAEPDGYTLVWTVLPTAQSIYLDEDRDGTFHRDDVRPIGMVYGAPFAVSVNADSEWESIDDLIASAQENPGGVRSGTTGFMSTGHFANIEFQRGADVEMATVNFQGGGPQLTALLGEHIDVGFNSIGELLAHVDAGNIRVLAVMDDERSDFLPDVPTLREAGVDANPVGSYIGLSAPVDVSDDVIEVLADSLRDAVQDEGFRERMAELGNTIMYYDPDDYTAFWDAADESLIPLIEIAKTQTE